MPSKLKACFVHVLYARQLKCYIIHALENNPIASDVNSMGLQRFLQKPGVESGEWKPLLLSEPMDNIRKRYIEMKSSIS